MVSHSPCNSRVFFLLSFLYLRYMQSLLKPIFAILVSHVLGVQPNTLKMLKLIARSTLMGLTLTSLFNGPTIAAPIGSLDKADAALSKPIARADLTARCRTGRRTCERNWDCCTVSGQASYIPPGLIRPLTVPVLTSLVQLCCCRPSMESMGVFNDMSQCCPAARCAR